MMRNCGRRYKMVMRLCGFQPVWVSSYAALDELPGDLTSSCVFSDRPARAEAICSRLLSRPYRSCASIQFVRHGRERLPFDVVLLQVASTARRLITAIHHLVPNGARPS